MATGRIGTTPVLTTRWSKAPSAGTTSLSGLDDNSVSLVYSVGYEAVYQNGVLLSRGNDYTATNGTTITLTTATVAGDIIEVFANQTIPLTDTYSQTVSDGRFIKNTLTTTTGDIIYASAANTPARLGIGSTDQVLKVSGGIPAWGAVPATTPTFSGCFVGSAGDTIPNVTATITRWNTEVYDTDGYHDNTNPNWTKITIPSGKAGYFLIHCSIRMAAITSTSTASYIALYKNGSILRRRYPSAYARENWTITCIENLSVGDYLQIYLYQDSGVSKDTVNGDSQTDAFMIQYLGA